jgi:hypothetical protein
MGLNQRAEAMLRAVAAGRAEISLSRAPDLFVDGMPCCDQITARQLAGVGLVGPARPGLVGPRVRAALTAAGNAALGVDPPAA